MLRSALFLLFIAPYALAQTSAPPQGHEQHASPAPAAQQPATTPQQHSEHASPAAPTPQAPGAPSSAPAAPAPPTKPVAPTAPVITLNGLCETASTAAPAAKPSPQNCKKVITKADFEKILDAVIPKNRRAETLGNPQVKQAIARQFAEILVMANEAKKRGIQQRPATQELLRISQMQVLAQSLLQDLNEKATPSQAEIEKYYNDNKAAFEEGIVRRLFVPKEAPPATQPAAASGGEAKPAQPAPPPVVDAAAQKVAADKARERAVAGEDFDKIQSDAFLATKNTQAPPTTQLGPRRRGSLPPDHDAAVFALKPGEVSQLFDTANGWYLYKLESKRMVPLSEVREEILRRLQPQKFNDSRNAIANSVRPDFNPDYFGASAGVTPASGAPAPPGQPSGRGPGGPRTPRGSAHPPSTQPSPTPETQPK